MNKPTKISVKAKLARSMLDFVCHFRTRQKATMIIKLATIGKRHLNEPTVTIVAKRIELRVSSGSYSEIFGSSINSSFTVAVPSVDSMNSNIDS